MLGKPAKAPITRSFPWKLQVAIRILAATAALAPAAATALTTGYGSPEQLEQESAANLRGKISRILGRYCPEACELLSVEAKAAEILSENLELGFEGINPGTAKKYFIQDLRASIQIDERINAENKESLASLLQAAAIEYAVPLQVGWHGVRLPKIGELVKSDERLAEELRRLIDAKIAPVLTKHCPHLCVVSDIAVDSVAISQDEAKQLDRKRIFQMPGIDGIIRVDAVDIDLSVDNRISDERKAKILNLLRANLGMHGPVTIRDQMTDFPDTYAEEVERRKKMEDDPFQLDRLRETLQIFREMAGTKEIITNNSSSNTSEARSSESRQSDRENTSVSDTKDTIDTKDSSVSQESTTAASSSFLTQPWVIATAAGVLLLAVCILAFARFQGARREAGILMESVVRERPAPAREDRAEAGSPEGQAAAGTDGKGASSQLTLKVRIAELKDELTRTFIDAPKIAKETYGRILQQEGVEQTSKYVHIFGHTVIFELLDDPNYQRDLFELSEYHHNTSFQLTLEEQLALLNSLKTKVTATEIKVLSQKTTEKFDFLLKLDGTQIFDLLRDEKPAVQCIAMTQLDHRRRRLVFEMFQGQARVELMQELCRAEAIPKDYLFSVANALQRKINASAKYDTANLRSSDILFDLLERAPLHEQRALMANLHNTNPEAARGIKMKLITIETLPYLKDGHLLDIILNVDRNDLLCFLKGAPEHIQSLLFAKVPEELAMSWDEELRGIAGIDDKTYRMVEMKILNKIRNLSSAGALNILDINDIVFSFGEHGRQPRRGEVNLQIPRGNLAA